MYVLKGLSFLLMKSNFLFFPSLLGYCFSCHVADPFAKPEDPEVCSNCFFLGVVKVASFVFIHILHLH